MKNHLKRSRLYAPLASLLSLAIGGNAMAAIVTDEGNSQRPAPLFGSAFPEHDLMLQQISKGDETPALPRHDVGLIGLEQTLIQLATAEASKTADAPRGAGPEAAHNPTTPPTTPVAADISDKLETLAAELKAQRALIEQQAQLIAAQQAQLSKMMTAQLQSDQELSQMRGAGPLPPVLIQSATAVAAAPIQTVGEAPSADHEIAPKVASVPEGQGVLTRKGMTVLESSFQYTHSSKNRLVFRGIELVPGLQLGLIEASDADRDAMIGTIAVRHGLTSRLEIEARMPVLARQDRIQVVQQRDQSITRELRLHEYNIGDAEVAVRYQLNAPKGPEQPIYVASLRVKSDTGKGPFDVGYDEFGVATGLATGSGFWGVQAGGSFLLPSDPAVIYGGMSYLYQRPKRINRVIGGALIGKVDPGDAISANLGFGFALNPRFSFSLGYNHNYIFPTKTQFGGTTQRSKGLQVGSFNIGTSYRLSERQSISFGFEFGVTSDAPDLALSMRLPIQF